MSWTVAMDQSISVVRKVVESLLSATKYSDHQVQDTNSKKPAILVLKANRAPRRHNRSNSQ
ncbi:hypothetical protein K7432_009726 [Basidiobolus ranarum]|uniref:Uncharacterized protein n=1 Tax=Basidiobolus ranarum TaxID=34480 RepID=A0ABR2WPR3_9FUNG